MRVTQAPSGPRRMQGDAVPWNRVGQLQAAGVGSGGGSAHPQHSAIGVERAAAIFSGRGPGSPVYTCDTHLKRQAVEQQHNLIFRAPAQEFKSAGMAVAVSCCAACR